MNGDEAPTVWIELRSRERLDSMLEGFDSQTPLETTAGTNLFSHPISNNEAPS